MSEELIPTKDETVNKTPGTPTAVPPVDTDVSNIVPFASEMPGSTEINREGAVKEARRDHLRGFRFVCICVIRWIRQPGTGISGAGICS